MIYCAGHIHIYTPLIKEYVVNLGLATHDEGKEMIAYVVEPDAVVQ